jgi:hypothetical protein
VAQVLHWGRLVVRDVLTALGLSALLAVGLLVFGIGQTVRERRSARRRADDIRTS